MNARKPKVEAWVLVASDGTLVASHVLAGHFKPAEGERVAHLVEHDPAAVGRMTPDQFNAKRASDRTDHHQRLRVTLAARLIAAGDLIDFHLDPSPGDLDATRAAMRRALIVADLLIEEAAR